ncbi:MULTISPECIES: hypothetical protein [Dehalobacter]|jgi:uncharacterized membrane protein|uniref:Chloroplast import component protein (Tic20) n=2 Tax=Dehalobacter restrictus TaxID=55583 RepID=A0A857DFH8_9FIRM|nr:MULTISPECIES: hypothetical protein [Dehalobacter]AHF09450.1 hypothetical protein DEHRE_04640 [Dehalobacter restrictus DSM 9455]MCG1025994.1 hypothetical protein [Dehalobacter sp.]OCZ53197.1 hypothetical protein A7D23_08920 [Dehalobacter sp. TeCB1]QHA00040.1 hypothetical protein GQ588_04950 [Dehalobacter restrictus]
MDQQENPTQFTAEDIEKNKVISALAYIIFFLPLIVCSDSPFGKFHANQGLLLLIMGVAGSVILSFIPVLGWLLLPLFSLAILIIAILGLIHTLNGKAKELPVIGKYRIIKNE